MEANDSFIVVINVEKYGIFNEKKAHKMTWLILSILAIYPPGLQLQKKHLESLQKEMFCDDVLIERFNEERRRVELVLEAERLFVAQKAKCNYLLKGYRCTNSSII